MNIFHKNEEQRIITGLALVPTSSGDKQGDTYDEQAVESAVNSWSENGRRIYLAHQRPVPEGSVSVLQSFLSPVGYTLNGTRVPKGSFVLILKIHSDSLWREIKSAGHAVGFSVGGRAHGESNGMGNRLSSMDVREVSILIGQRPANADATLIAMKSEDKMDLNSPQVLELLKGIAVVVEKLKADALAKAQRELAAALAKEAQAAAARPTRRYRTFDDYQHSEYRKSVARDAKDVAGIAQRLQEPLENPAKPGTYFRQFHADLF